jgi:hypothetical protein
MFTLHDQHLTKINQNIFLVNIALKLLAFQAVYVSKITEGGATEKDGKLFVGDKVISVSVNFLSTSII